MFAHVYGAAKERRRIIRLVDNKEISALHLDRLIQYQLFSKKKKGEYGSSLVFYKYDDYRRYRNDKDTLRKYELKAQHVISPYSFIVVKRYAKRL